MHKIVENVTRRIIERSKKNREAYLQRVEEARGDGVFRNKLPCSNFAHDLAGCRDSCRTSLLDDRVPNIGIISSYNDLVSAHQPYALYPEIIKQSIAEVGGTAQFAGGVPAMCDGVTQGEPGMDLSLISRDVIAMSTVIGLSHNVFDGALLLGVCDKIMPGLLMGGLQFGHLPMILIPAGPMTSGLPNKEKAHVRERFAQGKIDRKEMLGYEVKAYHSPGTCTFYGTANSNQMLMEIMGLHLPGSSFVQANTPLREALTRASTRQIHSLTDPHGESKSVGKMLDEKSFVNAIIGLLTTGGSSNHTMHIVAMARTAGIVINWNDFHELSAVVPLLTRMYPNGNSDVNHFHSAGGMPVVIKELLHNGLLHEDVNTIMGFGLNHIFMKSRKVKQSISSPLMALIISLVPVYIMIRI